MDSSQVRGACKNIICCLPGFTYHPTLDPGQAVLRKIHNMYDGLKSLVILGDRHYSLLVDSCASSRVCDSLKGEIQTDSSRYQIGGRDKS